MNDRLDCPSSQDIVIFGGTGDLSKRKLLPALYNLQLSGLLPADAQIIGMARRDVKDEGFRKLARESIGKFSRRPLDESAFDEFARRLHFHAIAGGYEYLAKQCTKDLRLIYLSTPPDSMPEIVANLGEHNLNEGARLVLEKPFGTDLPSSRELDRIVHNAFDESQIYRIDHYLGKETVQNILVFRFGNGVFERIWSRDAIDHIQITIAEEIGIEDRGSLYEGLGALRDIVQNHALQVLALLTMEPPVSLDAESIRDEKVKLLRSIRPVAPEDAVFGQYTTGVVKAQAVPGYRDEDGVASASNVETYVALKLDIDNWRWAGVPVYLRTGKRLPRRATEAEAAFLPVPKTFFSGGAESLLHPNHLTHRIQPEEEISLKFLAKSPGPEIELQTVEMAFPYRQAFMVEPAEAYERLIHDVMSGDQMLFVRGDAVEASWQIVQPLIDAPPPVQLYEAGTWGPSAADDLVGPNLWHLR